MPVKIVDHTKYRSTDERSEESYDVGAHRRPIQKAKRYIKDTRQGAHSQKSS